MYFKVVASGAFIAVLFACGHPVGSNPGSNTIPAPQPVVANWTKLSQEYLYRMPSPLPKGWYGTAVAISSNRTIAVIGEGHLAVSRDAGATWVAIEEGVGDASVTLDGGSTYRPYEPSPGDKLSTRAFLCSPQDSKMDAEGNLFILGGCEHIPQTLTLNVLLERPKFNVVAFGRNGTSPPWGPGYVMAATDTRVYLPATLPGPRPGILTTSDSGKTWNPIWTGKVGDSGTVSLHFIDTSTGWKLDGEGMISMTSDGGTDWKPVAKLPGDAASQATALRFLDLHSGIVIGERGLLLKTYDGGHTWKRLKSEATDEILSIDLEGDTVCAVGRKGLVLISWDGGETWIVSRAGDDTAPEQALDIRNVAVRDGEAWFVQGDYLYKVKKDSEAGSSTRRRGVG